VTKMLLWLVVAAQVALVAAGLVLEALAGLAFSLPDAVGRAASILAFPAIGLFIISRRPGHPIGWLFCLANLGWAINNCAGSYARYALVSSPGSLPAGGVAVWLYTWPGSLSVALFVFLGLLFPDGTLLSRRWRYVAWTVVGWSVIAMLASAFAPGPVDDTIGFRIDNPLGIAGPVGEVLEPIAGLTQLLAIPLFAVAALCLILRQLRATGQERLQLKWFTSSVGLVVAIYVVQAAIFIHYGSPTAFPDWAKLYYALSIRSDVLVPIAAGIAILRYRLYDIDVIINRALVYGTLSATLVALYFAGIVVLQRVFVALTGEQSTLAVVASTLIIAAMFNPLRRRIQSLVDRRFYRRKYDAAKTLEAFSTRLRDEMDLQTLNNDLVSVVTETMQPAHVSLWLRTDTASRGNGSSVKS
jgi:hypothetical protein